MTNHVYSELLVSGL